MSGPNAYACRGLCYVIESIPAVQAVSTVAHQAMLASGRIMPNLMDVAVAALNDSRHPDEHRLTLGRVRSGVSACTAGDKASSRQRATKHPS